MTLLALEIDDELLGSIVVALDLAESPASVHHVGVSLHGLQLGFGRLKRRVFGDERGYFGGIHGCVSEGLNGIVERIMTNAVNPSLENTCA